MMPNEEWYSPAAITFQREQIIWILTNMETIEAGRWPPDFKITGYSGGKKGRSFGPAYFEVPCAISAEVKRRLKLTKLEGKLLYWQVRSGVTRFEDLEDEAQMALNFVSLFDFRKRPKYYIWKYNWRYYRKHRPKLRVNILKK
ncbi:MAG: hypothetical protein KKB38_20395 [Gammaproteobacteria bacterium]|nr:hypothetical protein [Gammaproteobacteria bacterium]